MFTNAEIEALKFYSTDGYRAINEFLRGERLRTVEVARHVESLDWAMVKSRLESDMILFRGIDADIAQPLLANLRIGATLSDAAFMSRHPCY